jgi:hypothetical protein
MKRGGGKEGKREGQGGKRVRQKDRESGGCAQHS